MNVLFINDSTTNPNWGGRAATVALRSMIRQSGGEIIKTITLEDIERSSLETPAALYSDEPDYRAIVGTLLPDWLLALRRRLAPNLLRDRNERLIPRRWADYDRCMGEVLGEASPWPTFLQSLGSIDVAVVFGDGDIYGNGIVPRTLFFLSFLIKKHFGKPVVMVDHTADLEHPDLLRVAQEVYPLFDDVVFRDHVSAERYGALCASKVGADAAFWFQPAPRGTWAPLAGRPTYFDVWPDTAGFDPSQPYLCVGGSALFGVSGVRESIVNGYLRLISRLRSSYGGQVVLTVSDCTDQTVFRSLAGLLDLPLIGPVTPVQQAVDIVGNADAYIGGRWHPSIFALRGGTPVLPLSSTTFKMQALTQMAGLPPKTFDTLNLEHESAAIERQLLQYLEQGNELRSRLSSWGNQMADRSRQNVSYLASLRALSAD